MQSVSEQDLARHPDRILEAVSAGEPTLVERQGKAGVALVAIVDYRLLRAASRYQSFPVGESEEGLTEDKVADLAGGEDVQDRYNLVLGYFLAGAVSLSRAGELLGTSYFDLRLRLHRLGLPTRQGPQTM